MKRLLAIVAIAVLALLVPGIVLGHSTALPQPPNSPEAKRVEALVNRAAEVVNQQGKAAFPAFRKKGSQWYAGDVYLFVYDFEMKVVFNAAFPKREGKQVAGERDKKGKLFGEEFVKVAQTKGAGWVNYWWPKPGQTEPSQKWGYVKAVTIDGRPALIAAGFYPN